MSARSKEIREWIPVAIGAAGIVFMTGFWAATGRFEPTFLALFGSLVGISEGANALRDFKKGAEPTPPASGTLPP